MIMQYRWQQDARLNAAFARMQTTAPFVHLDTFTSMVLACHLVLSDTMPTLHQDHAWLVLMIATPAIFRGIAFHATLLLISEGYHWLRLGVSPWLVSSSRTTEQLEGCCRVEEVVDQW